MRARVLAQYTGQIHALWADAPRSVLPGSPSVPPGDGLHPVTEMASDKAKEWHDVRASAVQLAMHPDLCNLSFIQKGTCDVTCHRCKPCPDPEGPKYCQANVQVRRAV